MKAKFVNEAIEDILKPKSDEEILSLIGDLSPDKNLDEFLIKSSEKGFLSGVKKALKMGANIHVINDYPLQLASKEGYYDIVEFLLKHGADVHANNDLAVRWASIHNHNNVVKLLKKYM